MGPTFALERSPYKCNGHVSNSPQIAFISFRLLQLRTKDKGPANGASANARDGIGRERTQSRRSGLGKFKFLPTELLPSCPAVHRIAICRRHRNCSLARVRGGFRSAGLMGLQTRASRGAFTVRGRGSLLELYFGKDSKAIRF